VPVYRSNCSVPVPFPVHGLLCEAAPSSALGTAGCPAPVRASVPPASPATSRGCVASCRTDLAGAQHPPRHHPPSLRARQRFGARAQLPAFSNFSSAKHPSPHPATKLCQVPQTPRLRGCRRHRQPGDVHQWGPHQCQVPSSPSQPSNPHPRTTHHPAHAKPAAHAPRPPSPHADGAERLGDRPCVPVGWAATGTASRTSPSAVPQAATVADGDPSPPHAFDSSTP